MVWLKRGDQCGSNDMISAGFGAVGAVVWVCKVAGGSTSGRHGCTHSVERVAGHWGTYSPASTCPHGLVFVWRWAWVRALGLRWCHMSFCGVHKTPVFTAATGTLWCATSLHGHASTLCPHFLTNCSCVSAVMRAD